MMRWITLSIFFLMCCGPQYLPDPNASVMVTSQYEDEPPKIILIDGQECNQKIHCDGKEGAECAVIIYNKSKTFTEEAKKLEKKELYLSAQLEYMQAMCWLSVAKIILAKSKLENFDDWQVAVTLGLEKKIENKIKACQRKIFLLKWKR